MRPAMKPKGGVGCRGVQVAFWYGWKLVVEMLGCRGGVKGGRRETGYSCWNVGRMGWEVENGASWKAGSRSMSYVSVISKNKGLAEETIWLQIGEGVVEEERKNLGSTWLESLVRDPFRIEWRQKGCWLEVLGGSGRDFSVWKDGDMRLGVSEEGSCKKAWWARIIVRLNERSLPASLQSCSNGSPELKVRGNDGDGSRASTDVEKIPISVAICWQEGLFGGDNGLRGESGPLEEGSSVLQKAHRVNGLVVEKTWVGSGLRVCPSFIRERHDEAFQAETTRYSFHSFPLVFRRVVEADVSIHPLSVVLTDESAAMTSFGEKMALVVVGETSPKESNFMRQLECGVESAEEWKSSSCSV
ncbi:hypothetical protein CK203_043006 [Vitis vinifera]|uniref:Uncharacterized protein n=1 Tax=Vitis vinifera TaxID=29760 RepID=A0A438GZ97_VITVI|nr:hypothetical protein CK203_043006 [Vitis vinifera]